MKHKTVVGVFGIPVRKDGKILLTQRYMPHAPKWHLKWQLPGGGMEYGESIEDTLHREIKEEISVDLDMLFPHPIVTAVHSEGKQVVLISYIIQIHGKPDINNDPDPETADWAWFARQEIAELPKLDAVPYIINQAFRIIDENDILKKIK